VAWISEIKNTLSLPFYLLSLDAFIDADRVEKNAARYRDSILYYAAAMLCKTSTVMLPAVLLLYCWWKRGRVSAVELKRILPYVGIALVLSWITIHFQDSQTPDDPVVVSRGIMARMEGAGAATLFYLKQFFYPAELIPIYPRWPLQSSLLLSFLAVPIVLVALWEFARRGFLWARHALFGLGFFLLNLFPVMGFIKMSYLNISWVADHLVYLPMIGLAGLVAVGAEGLHQRLSLASRPFAVAAIIVLCGILAWRSQLHARTFINGPALWSYTIQHNPNSWNAHSNLGAYLVEEGRVQDGLEQFQIALGLKPDFCVSHCLMGDVLVKIPGRLPDAIAEYQQALGMDPDYPDAHVNLGIALEKDDRPDEAIDQFKAAIGNDPNDYLAYVDWAEALAGQPGRAADAIAAYKTALQIYPGDPKIHNNLGSLLSTIPGALPEAIRELKTAVRLQPDFMEAHYNLGVALAKDPASLPEAILEYETVLQGRPDDLKANYNLALALAQIPDRSSDAIDHVEIVLRQRPDFEPAQQLLAQLQAAKP
jgi:tetratricopeptide (TPR) repeat protein